MNKKPAARLLSETCIYYTALCVVMILLQTLISGSFAATAINSLQFFMFLPFTFALALGNLLFRRLGSAIKRYLAHALCFAVGFTVGIYTPYAVISKPTSANSFVVFMLAFVLYGVIMLINALVSGARSKSQKQDTPYVSQYKKK